MGIDPTIIVAIIAAVPTAILGFLGLRASLQRDAEAARVADASERATWNKQVWEDNQAMRERIDAIEAKCEHEIDKLKAENVTLKAERMAERLVWEAEKDLLEARVLGLENGRAR